MPRHVPLFIVALCGLAVATRAGLADDIQQADSHASDANVFLPLVADIRVASATVNSEQHILVAGTTLHMSGASFTAKKDTCSAVAMDIHGQPLDRKEVDKRLRQKSGRAFVILCDASVAPTPKGNPLLAHWTAVLNDGAVILALPSARYVRSRLPLKVSLRQPATKQ